MVTADFEHLSDDVSTQRNKKGTAQDDDDGGCWQENCVAAQFYANTKDHSY